MNFDLVIKGGAAVVRGEIATVDIGIVGEKIAAFGRDLPGGMEVIDASGLLVVPGGIEGHCHIDEPPLGKVRCADNFETGSRAAAFGGNTTFIPFVNQARGESVSRSIAQYHARAGGNSYIDYGFHVIVSDPTPAILQHELPAAAREGCPSFKVFMCYDDVKLDDSQILAVMSVARESGALVMLHAENDHAINWLSERLRTSGRVAPKFFAEAHHSVVEREAVHRAISFAELTGARILIVHVSSDEALKQILWGRSRGLTVHAETCPQYLIFTERDLDRPGWDAGKVLCAPPPRTIEDRAALWSATEEGMIDLISSDHCAYDFAGPSGKQYHAYENGNPDFAHIPPGVPGIEVRLPLLFSLGVSQGRIDLTRFAELTSTNAAKIYGLYPRKGVIETGSDADIVIWDPEKVVKIRHQDLHDGCDYSPYEGMDVKGWPVRTILRGKTILNDGRMIGRRDYGAFLRRDRC